MEGTGLWKPSLQHTSTLTDVSRHRSEAYCEFEALRGWSPTQSALTQYDDQAACSEMENLEDRGDRKQRRSERQAELLDKEARTFSERRARENRLL